MATNPNPHPPPDPHGPPGPPRTDPPPTPADLPAKKQSRWGKFVDTLGNAIGEWKWGQ